MKKKLVTMLLATTMVASMFAGCGSDGGSKNSSDSGSVYMLNFKPETDQAWQDLAKEYSDEKGVDVTVVTAADGQYKTQLQSELAKKEAPTIFNIGSTSDCAEYADYIYDLKDSEIYKHQSDKSLSLEYDGKVAAVANCYECYGIIYNKAILENYCKNYPDAVIKSVDDIKDLDTLEKVATDINSNVDKINEACGTHITEAFASAGLDDGSNWRFSGHLAGIELYYEFKDDNVTKQPETIKGTYLPEYKNIFDLYLKDSTTEPTQLSSKTGDDSTSEFSLGEAAFYQNGTWAWTDLQKAGMKADSLGMLPIYIGVKGEEKQGLATGSENYWCINSKASDADKKATKDFLKWVVTSKTGIKSLSSDMGFTTPFKSFSDVKSDNPLVQAAVEDQNSGKTAVSWNFTMMPSEEWKNKLGSALLEYAQGTGDWNAVKKAFVDGWKTEYDAVH